MSVALAAPTASVLPESRVYCPGAEVVLEVSGAPETDQLLLLYGVDGEWTRLWTGPMEDGRLRVPAYVDDVGVDVSRFRLVWGATLPEALLASGCRQPLDEADLDGLAMRELVLESHYSCESVPDPVWLQVDPGIPPCGAPPPLELPPAAAPERRPEAPREVIEVGGARLTLAWRQLHRSPLGAEGPPTPVLDGVSDLRCRPGGTCVVVMDGVAREWDPTSSAFVDGGIEATVDGTRAMSWVGEALWVGYPDRIVVHRRGAEAEVVTGVSIARYADDVLDGLEPRETTFHDVEDGRLRTWSVPPSIQRRRGDHLELSLFDPWSRGDEVIPAGALVRVPLAAIEDGPLEVLATAEQDTLFVDWVPLGDDRLAVLGSRLDASLVRIVDGKAEPLGLRAEGFELRTGERAPWVAVLQGLRRTWVRVEADGSLFALDGTPYDPGDAFVVAPWRTGVVREGTGGPVLVVVDVDARLVSGWTEHGTLLLVDDASSYDPTRTAVAAADEAIRQGWAQPGELLLLAPPEVALDALTYFPGRFGAVAGVGSAPRSPWLPSAALEDWPPVLLVGRGYLEPGELEAAVVLLRSRGADVQWAVHDRDELVSVAEWLKEQAR